MYTHNVSRRFFVKRAGAANSPQAAAHFVKQAKSRGWRGCTGKNEDDIDVKEVDAARPLLPIPVKLLKCQFGCFYFFFYRGAFGIQYRFYHIIQGEIFLRNLPQVVYCN